MIPPKVIETARLILRVPIVEDAEIIFCKYAQDQEVTKYLIWRPHETVQETNAFIEDCIQGWKEENRFPWVVVEKKSGELAGMIDLRINDNQADFGYVLARECWGKGYATEMVQVIVDWLVKENAINRIWAVCDCENLASARVLEKAGLQKEGILYQHILHPNISDQARDCFIYGMTKPKS